jgi:hypothetical protein
MVEHEHGDGRERPVFVEVVWNDEPDESERYTVGQAREYGWLNEVS